MEHFIKQVDDFLSLDGFKRAALEEKFLNATMIFLKTKLLEIATLDWEGAPSSELFGQLKRHVPPPPTDQISQLGVGGNDLDLESSLRGF